MSSQTATLLTRTSAMRLELPSAEEEVLPGVLWGAVEAFPTPAYWLCQVMGRRVIGAAIRYKLGRTLAEEVGACLLGGHGIPAAVGIAAYQRLRDRGVFGEERWSAAQLEDWLREPLLVRGRQIRYRFAAQKARYLAAAVPMLRSAPEFAVGRQLRDWLLRLDGVGPKTASWITRNWMDADDVAILDIHIMRVGQMIGLFPRQLTVARHYELLIPLPRFQRCSGRPRFRVGRNRLVRDGVIVGARRGSDRRIAAHRLALGIAKTKPHVAARVEGLGRPQDGQSGRGQSTVVGEKVETHVQPDCAKRAERDLERRGDE